MMQFASEEQVVTGILVSQQSTSSHNRLFKQEHIDKESLMERMNISLWTHNNRLEEDSGAQSQNPF